MRTLVVTTWYPTAASASTGIFVARDVAALAANHDVRVLHLCAPWLAEGAEPDQAPGSVRVERLVMDPRRPDHLLRARRRIRDLAEHADLLHTMAISALLPMAGRRPAVPWVHTEHWSGLLAPHTLTPVLRAARRVVRPLLSRPDVVTVVGQDLATGMAQLRRGPVVIVPNIVTVPARLTPRRDAGQDLADRGTLELIGVGALIERKDPLTAVATAAALRERGIDARLTWIGDGPLQDAVARAAASRSVPVELTGPVPPAEVQTRMAAADVFLLPTRAETFCLAAAEALAAGRPVVVGDTDGPRDFVTGPDGALVTPGAPAGEWADAVQDVWRSNADRSAEQVGEAIRRTYSHQAHTRAMGHAYALAAGRMTEGAARTAESGETTATPAVDVVVAAHSTERPVVRAVSSVLGGSGEVDVRVTVVCHNLTSAELAQSLPAPVREDPRLRLLELHDGIASPSGPFNHGMAASSAPWVAILGSDDTLESGALAAWLVAARGVDPEQPVVVIPPLRLNGRLVPTPPARPWRTRGLDLVKDRLSYRSAPLGLLSRGALRLPGAELLPGAQVGGDVPMVTVLWSQADVRRASGGPAYSIHDDADDRVTYATRPIAEQLRSVDLLWDLPGALALSDRQRRSVATKVLRIHVFGALLTRQNPSFWTPRERADLARITRRVIDAAPGCTTPLSRADTALLDSVLDPAAATTTLLRQARARRRHGRPATLLPADPRGVLDPEAPLRLMGASVAVPLLDWLSRVRRI